LIPKPATLRGPAVIMQYVLACYANFMRFPAEYFQALHWYYIPKPNQTTPGGQTGNNERKRAGCSLVLVKQGLCRGHPCFHVDESARPIASHAGSTYQHAMVRHRQSCVLQRGHMPCCDQAHGTATTLADASDMQPQSNTAHTLGTAAHVTCRWLPRAGRKSPSAQLPPKFVCRVQPSHCS